jgi:uncharacterized protein (DUF2164 family)
MDYMRNENGIRLTKEHRDEMVAQIKYYFFKEREEEVGDLAAGLILDFIITKLAPEFYNQGVIDAHQYMHDAAEDLLSIRK